MHFYSTWLQPKIAPYLQQLGFTHATAELGKAMQPWTDRAFLGPATTYTVELNALATALMNVTSLHPDWLEGAHGS